MVRIEEEVLWGLPRSVRVLGTRDEVAKEPKIRTIDRESGWVKEWRPGYRLSGQQHLATCVNGLFSRLHFFPRHKSL